MERQFIRHRASEMWHIVDIVETTPRTGNPRYWTYCNRYYYDKQYEIATAAVLPVAREDDDRVCYDCRLVLARRERKRIYHAPRLVEREVEQLRPEMRRVARQLLPSKRWRYETERLLRWNEQARALQQQLCVRSSPP